MRLIYTLQDPDLAQKLSAFLKQRGIENSIESTTNTDWGSVEYGTLTCRIWVYEEDFFKKAQELVQQYLENPDAPKSLQEDTSSAAALISDASSDSMAGTLKVRQPLKGITKYLLITCVLLFLYGIFTTPIIQTIPVTNVPLLPIFSPEINKELFFDYPLAYSEIDQFVGLYGIDGLNDPQNLPEQGKLLFEKFQHTPYWQGFYPQLVAFYKSASTLWSINAPLFEKIHQGEVWRLITPILLHSDIFHLFFNMIWLIVLGKQVEQHLGKLRYLGFILVTGILTNSAQYLMIGSSFLGFSGVLCAMLTFIWARQKYAPWEGYLLDKGTIVFVLFFIFFMFGLQLLAFFLEAHNIVYLNVGIANTAHLTGAFLGWLLARLNLFSWQHT